MIYKLNSIKYAQFLSLKKKWIDETKYQSSITTICENKYYKKIVLMGDDVVPYMIYDFKIETDNPPFWFEALRQITGYSPKVEDENIGKISEIAKLWVEWYENKHTEVDNNIIVEVAKSMLTEANPLENCEWSKCRYGNCLVDVLNELGAVKILREQFTKDYQGEVDIDALLRDGRIFSYSYSYGSCSGCDTWEAKGYTEDEIREEMIMEATFFTSLNEYQQWLKMRQN